MSFIELMLSVVFPRLASNPLHIRLDGRTRRGNRQRFAEFYYEGRAWRINADSRYLPLNLAFDAATLGLNPFVQSLTEEGAICLVLAPEIRALQRSKYKYLYIYPN
jgi:hypothetical protein